MQPFGIALLWWIRVDERPPPIESEAWWMEFARRESRSHGVRGDRTVVGPAPMRPLGPPREWIGAEEWIS